MKRTNRDMLRLAQLPFHAAFPTEPLTLVDVERDHIANALRESNRAVDGAAGAAACLGVKRITLISKMRRLCGPWRRGLFSMRHTNTFVIESELFTHTLLLNGLEIGTFATADAAEKKATELANCAIPGTRLRFELDFKWTLSDLEIRVAKQEAESNNLSGHSAPFAVGRHSACGS